MNDAAAPVLGLFAGLVALYVDPKEKRKSIALLSWIVISALIGIGIGIHDAGEKKLGPQEH